MNKLEEITAGKVIVDGRDISRYSSRQLTKYRRDDIGFVFQFYNLIQNLNALENVELALQISKHPLDAKEVLKDVGLEDRMYNFPSQLSGGEQQRVAIARALMTDPKVLLCDEATSALDSLTEAKIQHAFDELAKNRTTLIIAHRLSTIRSASRSLVVADGRICEQGTHEELMRHGGLYATLRSTQDLSSAE